MIQDIFPHIFNNSYQPAAAPESGSYILYYCGKEVLVKRSKEGFSFPTLQELLLDNQGLEAGCTYLFSIDGRSFYLAADITIPREDSFGMENTEIFRRADPKYLGFAGITGFQLHRWYNSRRFCGSCGKPMSHSPKERMMFCPDCGNIEYPKICPAVIVAVTDGDRLLMSQYANRNYKRYALIAGFAEVGETIEETVKREVMEEVGLKVKNLRYYKSQPWSFTDTLLLGFYAELDGSPEITLDKDELAMASWFTREEIPDIEPEEISLTNEMIGEFKKSAAGA